MTEEIEELRALFIHSPIEERLILKWQQILLFSGLHIKKFDASGMFTYAKTKRWDACTELLRDNGKWKSLKSAFAKEEKPYMYQVFDEWLKKNGCE